LSRARPGTAIRRRGSPGVSSSSTRGTSSFSTQNVAMRGGNLTRTRRELESASRIRSLEKENALLRDPPPTIVVPV
jgi:hypothetical protein